MMQLSLAVDTALATHASRLVGEFLASAITDDQLCVSVSMEVACY